jgi:translocation and assembly module TamB
VKRRWLKRALIALAALLVLLALLFLWLGNTGSGLRFVLGRAVLALDDKLSYESAEGSLFGGMTLRNVRYHDPAVGDYRVALIEIAPRSRRLLSGELYLTGLHLRDVRVALPAPAEETPPADEPFVLPIVIAPISMRIADLTIEGIDVRAHDDTPVIALDRIAGAAGWRGAAFEIEPLEVVASEGEIRAHAAIDTAADWAGEANADFHWQLPDQPQSIAGHLALHGPQQQPSLHLELAEPSSALIDLSWLPGNGEREWRLDARSAGFDLSALIDDSPVRMLTFDVDGTGTAGTGNLTGRIGLDGYAILIDQLVGSYQNRVIIIDALGLREENRHGVFDAVAKIDISDEIPTGDIDAEWQKINPPLTAPFDRLASQGRLIAHGSLDRLVADFTAEATVAGKLLGLELHAEGNPRDELRFSPLVIETGNGRLNADGALRLEPALAWQAQVQARGFDPGLLLPEWPGHVDLDAKTHGSVDGGNNVDARIDIDRLGGTLRQRPLRGSGHVELAGTDRIDTDLDLRLGDNTLDLAGRLGGEYDARARFSLRDFALFADKGSGHAEGDITVRGQWPALAIAGRVEGSDIAMADWRIGALTADADLRTDFSGDGTLDIDARDLVLAGEPVQRLHLEGRGDAASNTLRMDIDAERGHAEVAMTGTYDHKASTWQGLLQTLQLTASDLPAPLALRAPAALRLSGERIALEQACLAAENSQLCLAGDWQSGTGGHVGFDLARLPLAWLVALSGDETLLAGGELGGRGRLRIGADGSIDGQAEIEGTPGHVRLVETDADEDARDLITWTRLATTVEMAGNRRDIDAVAELSPAGLLRARIGTEPDATGTESLSGTIDVDLPDLSFIELLTPDVAHPIGHLQGRLTLAGTTAAPRAEGSIDLRGFRAELPALGLELRDSTIALRGGNGNRIEVDGRIATAEDSTLMLGGWFGLPANGRLPMDLRITGERVLVADIPAARVFVTPDLSINATEERLNVRGSVEVPQARIMPEQIEGGVTAASPDVRIVDADAQTEEATAEQNALPLFARVDVRLGDRVNIEGYGLKGRLSGQLQVRERPGRPTTGRGEIVVTGVYQAYGQDLDIERGRLLFSNTPLDNPLLDIRATRKIEAITAGLTVTGNAQRPVLEVYSVPPMDQAEALSYLVLGRPLRQATSAQDQDALGTAATAVTTAGGDLLAKSLGNRLGLDEVGVGTSRDLGAGALTVGKYLSPRLYLGYGRNLFDGSQLVTLRYRLTERFELEAQSGTRENKAGINYRYEK